MIRGKKNLIEYFKICNNPYWTIYPANLKNGNPIAKSPEDDSYSMEQSEEDLTKALNILATGNTYLVTLKKSFSLTKGYAETKYDHFDESVSNTIALSKDKFGFNDVTDFQKQLEDLSEKKVIERLERYKKEQEVENLQNELSELRKEVKKNQAGRLESFIMGFVEKNPMVLDAITALIAPKTKRVGIAGFNNNQKHTTTSNSKKTNVMNEENKTDQEILENSLQMWSESDPEFLIILQKISELAYHKPELYNTYKPLLLKL